MPTILNDDEENKFQQWYSDHAKNLGINPDPDHPLHFYDFRGAYKAGAIPNKEGHWPSKWKLKGHPRMIINGINTKTGEPASYDDYFDEATQ